MKNNKWVYATVKSVLANKNVLRTWESQNEYLRLYGERMNWDEAMIKDAYKLIDRLRMEE